jgi:hypothetical protein
MDLSAIRTETRNLLDDVGADRWSDSDLNLYINQAQYDFNVLTQIYRGPVQTTVTNGTSEYTFAIIGPILRVEYYTSAMTSMIALNLTTEEKLDNLVPGWRDSSVTGQPTRFLHSKNDYRTILVYPKPGASQSGHYLKVYGAKVPTTLTNSFDVPLIPEEYHHALSFGAASRALQRNNDAMSISLAEKYETKFNSYVQIAQTLAKASFGQ